MVPPIAGKSTLMQDLTLCGGSVLSLHKITHGNHLFCTQPSVKCACASAAAFAYSEVFKLEFSCSRLNVLGGRFGERVILVKFFAKVSQYLHFLQS